jgi:putative membrane protein
MHALTWTLLALGTVAYTVGVRRLWRRAGFGRGLGVVHVASFGLAMSILLVALLSPLHHLAEERLWAHMVQHELLMVIAAPLLVAARPLVALRLPLPKWLSDPLVAWIAHAAAIWLWHVPGIFEAAAHHEALHFAQHASFLVSALMFWWTVFARPGAGVASLFTTMLHTGALGALMALSNRSWYAGYALEDQQLAGLVMWVPAGAAYPLAALLLLGRALRRCAT